LGEVTRSARKENKEQKRCRRGRDCTSKTRGRGPRKKKPKRRVEALSPPHALRDPASGKGIWLTPREGGKGENRSEKGT